MEKIFVEKRSEDLDGWTNLNAFYYILHSFNQATNERIMVYTKLLTLYSHSTFLNMVNGWNRQASLMMNNESGNVYHYYEITESQYESEKMKNQS